MVRVGSVLLVLQDNCKSYIVRFAWYGLDLFYSCFKTTVRVTLPGLRGMVCAIVVLCVHSSFAIILKRKRKMVTLL